MFRDAGRGGTCEFDGLSGSGDILVTSIACVSRLVPVGRGQFEGRQDHVQIVAQSRKTETGCFQITLRYRRADTFQVDYVEHRPTDLVLQIRRNLTGPLQIPSPDQAGRMFESDPGLGRLIGRRFQQLLERRMKRAGK